MKKTIGSAGIHGFTRDLLPVATRQAHGLNLFGCQDGEANAGVDQRGQGCVVGRRFRQPHPDCVASEVAPKIGQAPDNLRTQIVRREQGRDGMGPDLGQGTASGKSFLLVFVAVPYAPQSLLAASLEPLGQGRPHVEGHVRVVVDDGSDAILGSVDARGGVGLVALGMNACIPVRKGGGAWLARHLVGPRILPRRLVEVPVHDQSDGRTRLHGGKNVPWANWVCTRPPPGLGPSSTFARVPYSRDERSNIVEGGTCASDTTTPDFAKTHRMLLGRS